MLWEYIHYFISPVKETFFYRKKKKKVSDSSLENVIILIIEKSVLLDYVTDVNLSLEFETTKSHVNTSQLHVGCSSGSTSAEKDKQMKISFFLIKHHVLHI